MKKTVLIFTLFSFLFFLNSCKKENSNPWNIEIKNPVPKVKVVNISKEYYDTDIAIESFQQKYPWFQGSVSDADFVERRKDTAEIKIFQEAMKKIDENKLNNDLTDLFSHIKHYFPKFQSPQVFLYSSALQGIRDMPVFFKQQNNMVFVDVSAFLGDGNKYYQGLDLYIQKTMNPENIVPKISKAIAENIVPINQDHQKFIDTMVYAGKIMTLQDAFLPNTPNYLKINYTQKQYEWCIANEENIWNFFVEKNMVFSDDQRLEDRFIVEGPFSKFYTEIDKESSPQVGIFEGWQICRKHFQKNPETKLTDFLKMDATAIFNQSSYKPKN